MDNGVREREPTVLKQIEGKCEEVRAETLFYGCFAVSSTLKKSLNTKLSLSCSHKQLDLYLGNSFYICTRQISPFLSDDADETAKMAQRTGPRDRARQVEAAAPLRK